MLSLNASGPHESDFPEAGEARDGHFSSVAVQESDEAISTSN